MLRDVFYYGKKPNVHPREKFASSLSDARKQCVTDHFWVINEFCDYSGFDWDFDFEFLPDEDVWAEEHNNVWPSFYQKDSGTWLCSKEYSEVIIYRADVDPIPRKNLLHDNWIVPENLDTSLFDFSWHPDPTDPLYIYQFGTQWQKTGGPRYVVEGATEVKYLSTMVVTKLPSMTGWSIIEDIDKESFDFSWHPDDTEEPYIYVFGNTQYAAEIMPTLEYAVPGATTVKYVNYVVPKLAQDRTNWVIVSEIDETKFDFSWRPNPKDPDYIYVWGNKYIDGTLQSTVEYHVPGATEVKYMSNDVEVLPEWDRWKTPIQVNESSFDFTWRPDPREPDYIYVWGNKYIDGTLQSTVEYHVPGATEVKYMSNDVEVLPEWDRWEMPRAIDKDSFDFTWRPDPREPAFIYQFGTQWQKTGGPRYVVEGATEVRYMEGIISTALHSMHNWEIPNNVDVSDFDFSWHPDDTSPPYIYQFGTQWQKTGGPRYVVEGATEVQYVSATSVRSSSTTDNWALKENIDQSLFDFSWHPDDTSPPYIYVWGNQWNSAENKSSVEYHVPGATEYQYMSAVATRMPDKTKWEIPAGLDISGIDFSWEPNPNDPPYIYQFGTQWQKTGGPRYVVEGATEIKYIDLFISTALPTSLNWESVEEIKADSFDFSWHPDDTSPPFIYQFGTQWQKTGGPRYVVEGATEVQYVEKLTAVKLPTTVNWEIPSNVDVSDFDFSWHPSAEDPPYIYQFGTQWQKTGGPRYIVEGATEIKYIDTLIAKALPSNDNWKLLEDIDVESFDFSWHPDDTSPPFIYVWGNQWNSAENKSSVEYHVAGATEYQYMSAAAIKSATTLNWEIPSNVDVSAFDFSWEPNPNDPPYIYQFGTQWQKTGGPRYVVDGATEIKYISTLTAKANPSTNNWIIPDNIDASLFDFSWHPDDTSPAYVYQFPTQWAKTGGPQYVCATATDVKYQAEPVATTKPDRTNWSIPVSIDADAFDFSWHPSAEDPPYIYQFGTQWQKTGGPRYITPGTSDTSPIKYVNTDVIKAKRLSNDSNWVWLRNIDKTSFDFSWHPDDTEEPYIYVFGNTQYAAEIMPTVQYTAPGATDIKYVNDVKAKLAADRTNWEIPGGLDISNFDFSWQPNPNDPPYIYQFGTQWQKTGGPRYAVKDDYPSEIKYVNDFHATRLPSKVNWIIPKGVNVEKFDFSWHPDETAPKYVYQFGTLLDNNDGPKYVPPNDNGEIVYMERTEIKLKEIDFPRYYINTTLEDLINEHQSEIFWALRSNIDYTNFDFHWIPDTENVYHINVFGSPESELTQTYFVNGKMIEKGFMQMNYLEKTKIDEEYMYKLFKKIEMFFVDRGNIESQQRFDNLKNKFPNIQKTRYLNSWVDTINRCIKRTKGELCWILNSELDYTNFDFNYYPTPWQMKMVHVFGTQWSHWGTTFLVNSESFPKDTKYIKIIEHLSCLNFVKQRRATATNVLYDIVYLDHGNMDMSVLGDDRLIIKYEESYLKTFKNMLEKLPTKKEHFVWVASTICDYSSFDFTYICDPFAREQLHVFPSDRQKFGDTFLVNVNRLRELIDKMEKLEDAKINYNQHQRAKRLPAPMIITEGDTHVSSINADFTFPYAVFTTGDNKDLQVIDAEPMSLWTPESKTITVTSTGGTRIVVPKEAKSYIKKELYDYPYISTNPKLAKSTPMDIVFLSNGEVNADENYEHLLQVTKGLPNRVTRVDGVNGRVQAYHAAVNASSTPWAFTVFAKLKVSNKFDWNWQPDRLQVPKHYVFHAKNPVNGLVYGHQAMIAYNKKLTLANEGKGLDFTMDDEHEVVELLSGVANYNTDEWSTWRTAFREVLKLRDEDSEISNQRMERWLTGEEGEFGNFSVKGAKDALDYYTEVDGDPDKLKLSYEWEWLRERFKKLS